MEFPLVTVGIPLRNCEETVGEAIESVIKQVYPKTMIEVILVDDGCTDKTIRIAHDKLVASELKFSQFKTFGKGLGAARQIVLDNSRGKYIAWVDGDIVLSPNFLRVQVDFMEHNHRVWQARGKWLPHKSKNLPEELENMTLVEYESRHTRKSWGAEGLVGIGGSVCRTALLRAIGGFDEAIVGAGEDIDIAAKLLAKGWRTRFTEAPFFHKNRTTWRILWRRYFWYGYGSHYVAHKHPNLFNHWTRLVPISILSGLCQAFKAYRVGHKKRSFLLPIEYVYKNVAWCIGFASSHIDRYGEV